MNLKNKSYMQATEFKERQGFFSFFCEQAFEFIKQFAADCRTGWKALFTAAAPKFENRTFALPFATIKHREWQERATQVYLKLVNG